MPEHTNGTGQSRRQVIKVGAGALTAGSLGLAGCTGGGGNSNTGGSTSSSGSSGGSSQPSTPASTPNETTTQAMQTAQLAASHYPIIIEQVPPVVADKKGFFKDHNVDVSKFTSTGTAGNTVRGVVTGGLAAGLGGMGSAVKAYLAGAPLHIVGLIVASNPIEYDTLPDSDIESIQDLAGGGTIAVSGPGSSTEGIAMLSVHNADGITLDDVEIKYTGGLGQSLTALNKGLVDVSMNIIPKSLAMIQKNQVRRVWAGTDYAPHFSSNFIYMGQRTIQENTDLAKGIVGGLADAIDYIQKNPEDSAKIWAQVADIPEQLAVTAVKTVNPDTFYTLSLEEDVVKATAEALGLQGIVQKQPPLTKILDQELLPADLQVDWLQS